MYTGLATTTFIPNPYTVAMALMTGEATLRSRSVLIGDGPGSNVITFATTDAYARLPMRLTWSTTTLCNNYKTNRSATVAFNLRMPYSAATYTAASANLVKIFGIESTGVGRFAQLQLEMDTGYWSATVDSTQTTFNEMQGYPIAQPSSSFLFAAGARSVDAYGYSSLTTTGAPTYATDVALNSQSITFPDAASYLSTGSRLYDSEYSLPSTNIVLSWPLHTDALDVSGNAYNGTGYRAALLCRFDCSSRLDRSGNGNALTLTDTMRQGGSSLVCTDGAASATAVASTSTASLLNTRATTLFFWLFVPVACLATPRVTPVITFGATSTTTSFLTILTTGFLVYGPTAYQWVSTGTISSIAAVPTKRWMHIAYTASTATTLNAGLLRRRHRARCSWP
ncbi:hypothetical protein T492DRAFT_832166 [Pavlovales sp. CCMP2436]|nr:hypothetical protein T492DRAFT_832166 [Pavlovales sp. CCMP2436]